MEQLIKPGKNFKYFVHAVIMQKNGAGITQSHTCWWDTTVDGFAWVQWPTPKQKENQNKT